MPVRVPSTRVVGRQTELFRIRGVIERATLGESAAVVITGEPGVGKTGPIARATNHPTALSFTLTMAAMLAVNQDRFADALRLATEAVDAATAAGDGWAFVHAVMWEVNASPEPYGEETADLFRRRREQLAGLGGADSYRAQLATAEAEQRLDLGGWPACERLLREALVSDPGPNWRRWAPDPSSRAPAPAG